MKSTTLFKFKLIITTLTVFLCWSLISSAQTNLMSNGSFETYTTCPNTLSQLTFATGFGQPTSHIGSPDYFNSCQTNTTAGVPTNTFGSTNAYQGQAYAGGYTYVQSLPTYREYVVGTLNTNLVAGQSYVVSFKYARSTGCRYASSSYGFYLSNSWPNMGTSSNAVLPVTPTSVNPSSNVLTSTAWQTYSDTIVANGGEHYITIGSFTQNASGTQMSSSGIAGAYMLVDDIWIYVYNGVFGDSNICLGDTAQLYAILDTNFHWVNANNPTQVISNSDTLYVSPTQTSTYWAITPNDTFPFTVNVHTLPSAFIGPDITLCEGDTAIKSVSLHPYSYLWSDNSTDSLFETTDSGTHWLELHYYTCVERDSFQVVFHEFPEFSLGNDTTICSYDNLYISTGLPNTYQFYWSTGAYSSGINISVSGTYTVTVGNQNCEFSDDIVIDYHPTLTLDLGYDTAFCYVNQYVLSPVSTNGTQFQWSTGSTAQQIAVSTSNVYYLTVSNGFCELTDSIDLTFYHEPTVNLGPDKQFCIESSYTIETGLTSPLNFRWMNNTTEPQLTTNFPGVYWVEVSDENCAIRDTVVLEYYPIIEVTLGEDVRLCEGESATLMPQTIGPVTQFLWNNGSTNPVQNVTNHGTYTLTVSDGICTSTDQVNVFVFEIPQFELGDDTAVCPDALLEFNVLQSSSNSTYQWSDGSTGHSLNYEASKNGLLWVNVSNVECDRTDSVYISLRSVPSVSLADMSICSGSGATLIASTDSAASIYSWNTGSTNSELITTEPGSYSVTVSDGYCASTGEMELTLLPEPEQTHLLSDVPAEICLGEEISIEINDPVFDSFIWEDGTRSSNRIIDQDGNYWVRATHACGVVVDSVSIAYCKCPVWLPNSFTPNGNSQNDSFKPLMDCSLTNYKFSIFDRWGELLFTSADLNSGWDGTKDGQEPLLGTYTWQLSYSFKDGNKVDEVKKTGTVVLLR